MSRRTLERVALAVGVVVLGFVLVSATLIDRRPPAVARVSLSRTAADGQTALTHATIDVEFSEPVDRASVEQRFRITPSVAGALSWDGERLLIFTPAKKLPVGTEFAVHVEAGFRDREGNASTTEAPPFTFRTIDLPVVSEALPLDGATGVALDQAIRLSFDRLMDTELTAGAVRVTPPASLAPSWQGTTLLLTPTDGLASGTSYRLTVGSEAADADGNPLARPFTLEFETVSTGLGTLMRLPADGSAGASPLSPIAIVFDSPIDPGSVAGALTVTPPVEGRLEVIGLPRDDAGAGSPGPGSTSSPGVPAGPGESSSPGAGGPGVPSPGATETQTGRPVGQSTAPGRVASPTAPPLVGPARVLRFTPNAPLAPHTTFTVRLRAGAVRALAAPQVAAGTSWTFTTGSVADVLQNQIVFLSARTGITNVWAMNPDGTNARQLTAELTTVTSYDVAADGRSLVYASAGRVRRLALPAGGALTEVTRPEFAEYAPRLVPDGRSVLLGRRERLTGADLGLWLVPLVEGAPAVRRVLGPGCAATGDTAPPMGSADAGEAAYATDGAAGPWSTRATISADGTLALVACESGALVRIDLATGVTSPVRLSDPAGTASWSSLGDAFLVAARSTGDAGERRAWSVPRRGPAAPGPAIAAWPAARADGAVAGISSTEPDRLAYQAGVGSPIILTLASDLLDRQPVFSPAGASILFVRVPHDDPTRSAGVWLVATDGRELRQLSPTGHDPRWLP